jgi:hypothetical protein
MEQIDNNLMFRWFVGLGIDDPVWAPTRREVAAKFMTAVLAHGKIRLSYGLTPVMVKGRLKGVNAARFLRFSGNSLPSSVANQNL